MLLELIGIYAAYKAADRYNDLKEQELKENEPDNIDKEIKILEREVKRLKLRKELEELLS